MTTLRGLACFLALIMLGTAPAHAQGGCLAAGGGAGFDLVPVPSVAPWLSEYPGLGPMIDAQLTRGTRFATAVFGVAPSVRYYDDRGAPNAFATDRATEGAPDGSVRIGVNLVSSEIRRFIRTEQGRGFTYTVDAVLAHELAHILQIRNGLGQPRRNTELQADYLAGWYFAVLAREDPKFAMNDALEDGLRTFYRLGDYNFNTPGHHGTPDQRLDAFRRGNALGPVSLQQAWIASLAYRSRIGG